MLPLLLIMNEHFWDTTGQQVFFEQDSKYIMIGYDTEAILDKEKLAEDALSQLRSLNFSAGELSSRQSQCLEENSNFLSRIKAAINALFGLLDRVKRNILGDFWASISGGPSPGQWAESVKALNKLEALQKASSKTQEWMVKKEKQLEISEMKHKIITALLRKQEREMFRNLSSLEIQVKETGLLNKICSNIQGILFDVELDLIEIKNMETTGSTHRASRLTIGREELKEKIKKISEESVPFKPLFGTDETEKYYDRKLTSISVNAAAITTTIKVPLIDFRREDWVDANSNTATSNLILIKNKRSKKYRYLKDSLLRSCIQIEEKLICPQRIIEMEWPKSSETYENTDDLPYNYFCEVDSGDLFEYRLKTIQYGTMTCGKSQSEIKLSNRGIINVPNNCSFEGEDFEIFEHYKEAHRRDFIHRSLSHPHQEIKEDIAHLKREIASDASRLNQSMTNFSNRLVEVALRQSKAAESRLNQLNHGIQAGKAVPVEPSGIEASKPTEANGSRASQTELSKTIPIENQGVLANLTYKDVEQIIQEEVKVENQIDSSLKNIDEWRFDPTSTIVWFCCSLITIIVIILGCYCYCCKLNRRCPCCESERNKKKDEITINMNTIDSSHPNQGPVHQSQDPQAEDEDERDSNPDAIKVADRKKKSAKRKLNI